MVDREEDVSCRAILVVFAEGTSSSSHVIVGLGLVAVQKMIADD